MKHRTLALPLLIAALAAGCARAGADYRDAEPDPELLHGAVRSLTDIIIYDIFSPPQASRAYAYASIAAYEALRHAYPGYVSLAGQLNELAAVPEPELGEEYHFPLAAVHAFMTVGKALTFSPARADSVIAGLHAQVRALGVRGAVFERSVAYGDAVAAHVLEWSKGDYFLQLRGYPKYTVTDEPGRWVPTPPAYMDAVEPNWARVRPFTLESAGQFPPVPPLPYDMREGSPFYVQAREVYEIGTSLDGEQREIAAFWDDNPYVMNVQGHAMFATKKMTPGGHWMNIAAIAARHARADMMQSAEAYARTAMALADGFIACWDEKFRSNVVRPETVINRYFDESWVPMLQTPPFPEYTSGHSVISTAAATVLTHQFGERFAFTDSTEVAFGLPVRAFGSFEEAAAEAAISRLYGGIHYRMAIDAGVDQGRLVGAHVIERARTRSDYAVGTP